MITLNRSVVKRVVGGMDWGFTNPGVLQVWAVDGDGRMYLVHEVYARGRLIEWWAETARAVQQHFRMEIVLCDPSEPAYIKQVQNAGVPAMPANNEVLPGIQAVQSRLKVAADGRPRLFLYEGALAARDEGLALDRKPVCTQEEFLAYSWAKTADGRPIKEEPLKLHDHGMDCARYVCMYIDSSPEFGPGSAGAGGGVTARAPAGVFSRTEGPFGARGSLRPPPGIFGR